MKGYYDSCDAMSKYDTIRGKEPSWRVSRGLLQSLLLVERPQFEPAAFALLLLKASLFVDDGV